MDQGELQARTSAESLGFARPDIHNTHNTEFIWVRATSKDFGTEKEARDVKMQANSELRSLFNGEDPIRTKRQVLEKLELELEEITDETARAQIRNSIKDRVDLVSRLGMARRGFGIMFGKNISQEDINFVDKTFARFWGAYQPSSRESYDSFLEFWEEQHSLSFNAFTTGLDGALTSSYFWYLFSGDSTQLHENFILQMQEKSNEDKVQFDFDSADGAVVVSLSIREMLSAGTPVSMMMFGENGKGERLGATDTLVNFYMPITQEEKTNFNNGLLNKEEQKIYILEGIRSAHGILGFGHGFGANKDVWNPVVGKVLNDLIPESFKVYGGYTDRVVGLSFSTKGSQGTTNADSGHMDRAAVQITDTLRVMGLGGSDRRKPLVWVGHSMGGQEALWSPMYADKGWNIKVVSITPVTDNSKELLTLIYGNGDVISNTGAMLTKLALMPKLRGRVAAYLGQGIGIVEAIARGLLVPSDMPKNHSDRSILEEVVKNHVEMFKDKEYMRAVYKALVEDKRM